MVYCTKKVNLNTFLKMLVNVTEKFEKNDLIGCFLTFLYQAKILEKFIIISTLVVKTIP